MRTNLDHSRWKVAMGMLAFSTAARLSLYWVKKMGANHSCKLSDVTIFLRCWLILVREGCSVFQERNISEVLIPFPNHIQNRFCSAKPSCIQVLPNFQGKCLLSWIYMRSLKQTSRVSSDCAFRDTPMFALPPSPIFQAPSPRDCIDTHYGILISEKNISYTTRARSSVILWLEADIGLIR